MLPHIITTSALLVGCSLAAPAPAPAAESTQSCSNYVLISARGTGEPQGPSTGFVGMIRSTLSAVPGGSEYDAVYPAAGDPTFKTTRDGAHDVERFIKQGLRNCPDQKYALLGYSQGASLTIAALNDLSDNAAAMDAIKAVVLIGNPFQLKNKPTTVDQFGGGSTRAHNGILLPLAESYDLQPENIPRDRLLNICYTGDPVCLGVAYGLTSPAHLAYPLDSNVQKMGGDYLISKLG